MKNTSIYASLSCCAILLVSPLNTVAAPGMSHAFTRGLTQKVTQVDNQAQIVHFIGQLAQKDPAKFATLLLEKEFTYVSNSSVIYIGIKGTEEVFVICKIEDSDVGDFYHTIHKQGTKYTMNETISLPSTQGFIPLFEVR